MSIRRTARILVLGDSGAGKTTLITSLSQGTSKSAFNQTPLDLETEECHIGVLQFKADNENALDIIEFWVVKGSSRIENSRNFFYRFQNYDALILVYDITWYPSRSNLRRVWIPEVLKSLHGQAISKRTPNAPDAWTAEWFRWLFAKSSSDQLISETLSVALARFLESFRDIVSFFIVDDLLDKINERRLIKLFSIPIAIIGTKADIASRQEQTNAARNAVPGICCIEVSKRSIASNLKLNAFLKRVLEYANSSAYSSYMSTL